MYKYLPKSDLPALIQTWMGEGAVYAPVGRPNPTAFAQIDEPSQAVLETIPNTTYPPKSLFLPQSEVLLKIHGGSLQEVKDASPSRLVLGIRPCDVHAMNLLDRVFLGGNHVDPYWRVRRERTTLIALACSQPLQSCFCTAVGLNPFEECGADAILIDRGRAYVVKVISEKGRQTFGALVDADATQIDEAVQSAKIAEGAVAVPFWREGVRDRVHALYSTDFWSEIQQACIGCGACAYLCPTCHCFDIVDEYQRGERVRNWDTCMFRFYTQEASGHNPRPSNLERIRNRIMHKYVYFPDRHEAFGCSGCGRCILHCPVSIDIRKVIQNALEFKTA